MRAQALLAALLTALAIPSAAAAAGPDDRQLEPTIRVDANAPAPIETKTTLLAGRTYTIAVNNSYFETIPTTDGGTFTYSYDGVYCYAGSTPTSVCSDDTPRLFEGGGLHARLGATGTFGPFYRTLGPFTGVPAFRDGHNYFYEFRPATTAKLQLSIARDLRDSYVGGISVTLYGPPSPGSTGPAGSEPATPNDLLNGECADYGGGLGLRLPALAQIAATRTEPRFCPKRLQRVPGWGRPAAIADLEPGGEATLLGPLLSSTQRQVNVTLTTSTGDVAVVLSEDDAKYRRAARRACFYLGAGLTTVDLVKSGLADGFDATIGAGAFTDLAGLASYLLPCLAMVDDVLAREKASGAARFAARACHAAVFPVKAGSSRTLDKVRVTTRRRYPVPNGLRVRCRVTTRSLIVSVSPRRSGVSLRSLVGKRLSVGLARGTAAKGTARGTIAFGR